ncbi:MAG: ATP-binding protein, partial [Candidatus Binataceae bacterium]
MAEPLSISSASSRMLDLRTLALAAIGSVVMGSGTIADSPETAFLRGQIEAVGGNQRWEAALASYLPSPAPADEPLLGLAAQLSLSNEELLAVALAIAVETDLLIGRAIARIQEPVGGSRPTLGLVSTAFAGMSGSLRPPLQAIMTGAAIEAGLLTLLNEGAPLPERPLMAPLPMCLALIGHDSNWPGIVVGIGGAAPAELPLGVHREAARRAQALERGRSTNRALALRSNSEAEARSIACAIADALGREAAFINNTTSPAGLGPWLILRKLLPVFGFELTPGERKPIPAISHYNGPVLALGGRDGSIEFEGESVAQWTIEVPSRDERMSLWAAAIGDQAIAAEFARHYRHGIGRVAQLARASRYYADIAGHEKVEAADIIKASRSGASAGLETLAQPLPEDVCDAALITTPALRADLERLYLRCRLRDGLAGGLGIATATRYQPGVRALFTGASGTGKTLAAGWLATRLGLPLYRVDLASVTSKY